MRTAVLSEPGELAVEERPRPDPAPDEVLVAVGEVGICGSDLHYYQHGRIGDYVVEDPLILGHESAGEVVAVGEAVSGLAAGDRVALEPGVPCRRCAHCKRGEYNLCPDVTFMATPPDDGAFAEYVAWPADFAYRLPESVSVREGALCEPLSVGLHVARRGEIGVGDSVLITGAGPIGLLAMEAARAAGATEIVVSDVVEGKLRRAEERGADATIDPRDEDLGEAVARHTAGEGRGGDGDAGVDVVVEASGAESAIAGSLDAVRRGGTVVFVGLADEAEVPLDVLDVVDNELDVRGSFRYRNTYPAAIDLLADGEVDAAGIVDFAADLDDVDEAFRRAMDPETVKGMVTIET
ncbi:NAD(P)-dependent alcohol dehydrogenase [Halorussus gelatinilyticus]|uniref:L-threonine 3-dehydrogenase n=1 Tax=Halorussus gelatinilyticus TaxID=2937524 RepID=A0A8U0IHL5_9EURY|nr:NAD(P)-dependent alcohol dehydrogenase [Halorussus gelatinilyticus]UPV99751.1 NAD(P)-dependent alcohol dehydrogenase [Halorussus gelatinilyticus]